MLLLKQKTGTKIEDEANKFKDNIFVITIDDGRENKNQKLCGLHLTVHKDWVKT